MNQKLKEYVDSQYEKIRKPGYSLQGIYEDYQKDEIPNEENLELNQKLYEHYKRKYNQLFRETIETLNKIKEMLGEENGN